MIYIYFIFTILAVCPQLLLEIRYFMVPNLFYQLYSNVSHAKLMVVYNLVIATGMLYVFVKKDVVWDDLEEVQMIIY